MVRVRKSLGFWAVALGLSLALGALAAPVAQAQSAPAGKTLVDEKLYEEIPIRFDGKALSTSGILTDGGTMVPVRALFEELGFTVDWINTDRAIVVSKGSHRLTMRLGSVSATAGDHDVPFYPVPATMDGRSWVPVRFAAENLGMDVRWDAATRSVDLYSIPADTQVPYSTAKERSESADLKLDIQYPQFSGLAPDVQTAVNAYFAKWAAAVKDRALKAVADAASVQDRHYQVQAVANYQMALNRDGLVSVVLDDYLFSGGAHGMTVRTSYTFDTATGKVYSLSDLFRPGTDYVGLLSREVKTQMDQRGLTPVLLTPFQSIRANQDFYIKGSDLVIYFQLYEYLPYAAGLPEFRVPLSSLAELLEPGSAAVLPNRSAP